MCFEENQYSIGSYLNEPLASIDDADIRRMIAELSSITSVIARPDYTLHAFLFQCAYRNGSGMFEKITREEVRRLGENVLGNTLRKLEGTALFRVCEEIATRDYLEIEYLLGGQLFVFLNKHFAALDKKQKKSRKLAKARAKKSF